MKIKKIYISGDHAGFELKLKIKSFIAKKGYEVIDFGPLKYNKKDDYPDFVIPMAIKLAGDKDKDNRGIIIAGSGIGETIAANKIKRIKAANYHGGNTNIVRMAREHDNINILCFGSRFVTEKQAKQVIDIFLKTKFQAGRHLRRLKKIEKIEK